VERAAACGIHMLIEKPIALTSEHAWQMVQQVEAAGVKTQVGFMFRFGEAIERLKGLLESGEVGPVGSDVRALLLQPPACWLVA
jgi:predicted dehydrogenase